MIERILLACHSFQRKAAHAGRGAVRLEVAELEERWTPDATSLVLAAPAPEIVFVTSAAPLAPATQPGKPVEAEIRADLFGGGDWVRVRPQEESVEQPTSSEPAPEASRPEANAQPQQSDDESPAPITSEKCAVVFAEASADAGE